MNLTRSRWCPYCRKMTRSRVLDSRPCANHSRRRRYQCQDCKRRFTTLEHITLRTAARTA